MGPDSCMPMTGPIGNDGNECAAMCPVTCPADNMHCGGGMDANGCPMPNTCMPMTGPIGNDGNECAVACPPACAAGDMICPGGMDHNGCPMPDTCMGGSTTACPAV